MLIDYLSNIIVPFVITLILIYGIKEKVKVFDCFLDGAKEGMEIVVNLFPTLIGLFMAIGILRSSGFIDYLIRLLNPVINFFHMPKEIMPLVLLRPISRECFYCNRNRYNEYIWGGQHNWTNSFNNYGFYRDYIIYYSNLYKYCKS